MQAPKGLTDVPGDVVRNMRSMITEVVDTFEAAGDRTDPDAHQARLRALEALSQMAANKSAVALLDALIEGCHHRFTFVDSRDAFVCTRCGRVDEAQ